jgi:diguanylate cyclase (GGDEF)-like protein/PAS domain S-box-containing protein
LAVTTPAKTITAANAALATLLGRDPAALIGDTFLAMTHPEDVARAGRIDRGERRLVCGDDRVLWVALSVAPLPTLDGGHTRLIVHVDDITRRRRREAELRHLALHDPLTGLANRALLVDRITAAIARLNRHTRPSHLFYLDLDGFKAVNDDHGHAASDAVLAEFAARITTLTRVGDTAARLGGDEFAVLCEDTDQTLAEPIAARLRAAAARPFTVGGVTVTLSASVGDCAVQDQDPADLLRQADMGMYAAKRRSRPVAARRDRPGTGSPTAASGRLGGCRPTDGARQRRTGPVLMPGPNDHAFQVDLRGIVELLSRHLYSRPHVYVRELLQNAVDAVVARRIVEPGCRRTCAWTPRRSPVTARSRCTTPGSG